MTLLTTMLVERVMMGRHKKRAVDLFTEEYQQILSDYQELYRWYQELPAETKTKPKAETKKASQPSIRSNIKREVKDGQVVDSISKRTRRKRSAA